MPGSSSRYSNLCFDQVMGKVPTISINKTDGCHVYLSKDSLDCEIVSAKSSEMNVLIPAEGGDFVSVKFGSQCGLVGVTRGRVCTLNPDRERHSYREVWRDSSRLGGCE